MATPVIMPKFGMAQEEGTILRWLKQEGERVEKGETLLEVLTDKIDMEVEAPASGILRDVRFGVDATVPVTTVIAEIADPAEEARIAASAPPSAPLPAAPVPEEARLRISPVAQRLAQAQGIDLDAVTGSGAQGRITRADIERANLERVEVARVEVARVEVARTDVRATPAARRLARTHGLDLSTISGSGPQGRIQAADVETGRPAAQSRTAHALPAAQGAPLRGMRRTIATRLAASWQTIPHIFLTARVDMRRCEAARALLAPEVERAGSRLTPTVLIARALAAALARHPRLNATLQAQEDDLLLSEHAGVHLGVAVALADGLIVPVIREAQTLGIVALAQRLADVGSRARTGQLTPDETAGGTFTLSSLGAYPVDQFTAIINPPQVAILAVGQMRTEALWDGAAFQPAPVLEVTLSADHRAVDGAVAAAFLADLKSLLEEPVRLLL